MAIFVATYIDDPGLKEGTEAQRRKAASSKTIFMKAVREHHSRSSQDVLRVGPLRHNLNETLVVTLNHKVHTGDEHVGLHNIEGQAWGWEPFSGDAVATPRGYMEGPRRSLWEQLVKRRETGDAGIGFPTDYERSHIKGFGSRRRRQAVGMRAQTFSRGND